MSEHPFAIAYRAPVLRDDVVQTLLSVGSRQLRSLVANGKLERAGDKRFHRIKSSSLLQYVGMPELEPENFEPWADLCLLKFSRQHSEVFGSDRQSSIVTKPRRLLQGGK